MTNTPEGFDPTQVAPIELLDELEMLAGLLRAFAPTVERISVTLTTVGDLASKASDVTDDDLGPDGMFAFMLKLTGHEALEDLVRDTAFALLKATGGYADRDIEDMRQPLTAFFREVQSMSDEMFAAIRSNSEPTR